MAARAVFPAPPPSDAGSAAWFSRAGSQTEGSENAKTNKANIQAFRDVFWLPIALAVRGAWETSDNFSVKLQAFKLLTNISVSLHKSC